ncbi:Tn3 family transposase [Streptomyces acidicola]|uniref:Tn3 family transposase n=1 Tax=Streptomyces acidicola TaxID=2596892 RepID=UPI0038267778
MLGRNAEVVDDTADTALALAEEEGAGVAAAHADDVVVGSNNLVGPGLGELAGDVAAELLRYLSDAPLRRRGTAATNKVEAFNGFSQWLGFGNRGVITDNDPVEQEKVMKFNALLTNAVVFHNALDIAEIVRQLLEEGWEIDPEELARISPYLTGHINRFGEYSTHELGIQPEAYDPKLDVDFTPLRAEDPAAGFTAAA